MMNDHPRRDVLLEAQHAVEQLHAVTRALHELPEVMPSIRSYSFGPNAGISPKANADYALVATFDDVTGWLEYDNHSKHDRVRTTMILLWITDRTGIQFES
jgi:hypothetical protein